MKQLLGLLICLSSTYATSAQERSTTLLRENQLAYGGFGGPFVELSTIGGQPMLSVGGGGAASINNRFFFGGFGQNGVARSVRVDNSTYRTQLSQGGLWLGYVFRPGRVVHLAADTRFGWTTLELTGVNTVRRSSEYGFVVAPSLGAEVNVTHFLRIRLTGGYRFAAGFSGSQPDILASSDLNSLVSVLSFQFGRFR